MKPMNMFKSSHNAMRAGGMSSPKGDNRMEFYNECLDNMFKTRNFRAFAKKRVITMNDLNVSFINSVRNKFYWNLFDDMMIDVEVAIWATTKINFDNLRYSEENIDCLRYAYPSLTSRARLEGDETLATVLREYGRKFKIDRKRLACQLISATDEFLREFKISRRDIKPRILDYVNAVDIVSNGIDKVPDSTMLVITNTNRNIINKQISQIASNRNVFAVNGSDELNALVPGDVIRKESDIMHIMRDSGRYTISLGGAC